MPRVRGAARGAWPLWVLGVLSLLPRVGFLARPFDSDGGLYVYMGKVVLSGQTLYRDFYETKLPGVPLFTAGLYRVFGDHWWAYVLLQSAMAVGGAVALARAGRRAFGAGAYGPALLFGLVFLNFSPAVYRGFQLETVQTFFACLAALFAVGVMEGRDVRERVWGAFWVGVFAGAGAMVKPTAGAVAAALVLTMLVRRRRGVVGVTLVAIGGALVAPGVVLAWTWRAGLLPEMPGLFREISLYGSQTPRAFEEIFKPLFLVLVGGFPFMGVWVFRRGKYGSQASRLNGGASVDAITFAVVWLVLECLGVYVQGRMYAYHMLPLAAPLALLFGAACAGGRRPVALVAGLGPVVLFSLAFNFGEFRTLVLTGPRNLATSEFLLAHSEPGDTVVGDGIERLLMETGMRCGSRYAHQFYFANHDAAPAEFGGRFLEDLENNRPTWAVFETDRATHRRRQADDLPMYLLRPVRRANFLAAWGRIEKYIDGHYAEVARVDGMTIYRRGAR